MVLSQIATDILNLVGDNLDFTTVGNVMNTLNVLEQDLKSYINKYHAKVPIDDLESLANILLSVKQLQKLLK